MKIIDFKVGVQIQSIRFGDIETIVWINYELGTFRTDKRYYRSYEYGIEWKYYAPEFDIPSDDMAQLELSDYQSLLMLDAVSDDEGWFDEVYTKIKELKAGEQHA